MLRHRFTYYRSKIVFLFIIGPPSIRWTRSVIWDCCGGMFLKRLYTSASSKVMVYNYLSVVKESYSTSLFLLNSPGNDILGTFLVRARGVDLLHIKRLFDIVY